MSDGGKGSAQRPVNDRSKFEENWDRIFGDSKTESPCCQICKMDEATGLCMGCFRTRDEIGSWLYMDDERRALVNASVEMRRTLAKAQKGER